MIRLGVILIVASCGKGESTKAAPARDVPRFETDGVVVTAKDVSVNGKSLGILPEGLVTDRQLYIEALVKRRISTPDGPITLAYTDDAAGSAVLAAMRGIAEHEEQYHPRPPAEPPPPPPSDPNEDPQAARAKAIEEARRSGFLGGGHAGSRTEFKIAAMVEGKPTEICSAMTMWAPEADDEDVELVAQIGHNAWTLGLTRLNDSSQVASADLESKLREHKSSTFFKDRDDAELVAAPDATGADVTPMITGLCKVGFRALRALSQAEAAAQLGASTKPTRAKVPTVSMGQPVANGDLDKAIIRRYVKIHVDELQTCYTHELATKPSLAGTVSTQFTISPTGKVASCTAAGVDPAVSTCVANTIKAIEFPKPKSGSVQVNFPFTYRAGV